MKAARSERVIYGREALLAWMARVKAALPGDAAEDVAILGKVVEIYLFLVDALSKARVRLGRLKHWLFGSRSEKKDALFPGGRADGGSGRSGGSDGDGRQASKNGTPGTKERKGHGRRGAKDYPGAERIPVPHPTFKPGCPCPDEDCDGKVYPIKKKRRAIPRFFGQALLIVKIWLQELWRCNLCERFIGAPLPPEASGDKYDVSAVVMLAVARFAYGLPAYRLEQHQKSAGVPIAASVQTALLRGAHEKLAPLLDELVRQAAQFDVFHNDDTGMKVLELLAKIKNQQSSPDAATDAKKKPRTGIHTTGIVAVSLAHGYQIALYFTGPQHAGENLADVLAKRAPGLPPPIHTSDGIDYNNPKGIKVITTKCAVHARRQFVDIKSSFPEQCRYVIEKIGEVYRVDDLAKKRRLSAEDRLLLHQEKSGPVMDSLRRWLVEQLLEGVEEPNSELGLAIRYLLRLWEPLTEFLRVPGVPLDNNPAERILKAAIRHRKNSLFYKTQSGARVGDFFMSLFETCDLNGVDKIHYLTTVLSNVERAREAPGSWMPWNYLAMLPNTADATAATDSPAARPESPVASQTPEAAAHEESAPRPASQPTAPGRAASPQEPGRSAPAGAPTGSSNPRSRKPASPASPVVRSKTAPSSRERKHPESTMASSPPPESPERGPPHRARPGEARSPT